MLKNLTIKSRLIVLTALLSLMLAVLGVIGTRGMASSNEALRSVYVDRTVPLEQLSNNIDSRMKDNMMLIQTAVLHASMEVNDKKGMTFRLNPAESEKTAKTIEENIEGINKAWKEYMATTLTPEEKKLAETFIESRKKYRDEGLIPAVAALRAGNYEATRQLLTTKVQPLNEIAGRNLDALIQLQVDVAKEEFAKSSTNYVSTRNVTIGFITVGILLALLLGGWIMRAVVGPLNAMLGYFDNIGKGNYDNEIKVNSRDETGRALEALRGLQQNLAEARVQTADFEGQIDAIGKSMGTIEFNLDGTVISANPTFLSLMGYTLEEAAGKHHSTFVEPVHAASAEYRAFWEKLNRGEFDAGEYKRIAKGGREVWIQASYNPIRDLNGKPYKVVKYASDITAQKVRNADFEGQIDAIGKSMGTIEFNLDGTVISANSTFLNLMGYTLEEAHGKHHRTFVEPAEAASPEYRAFWEKLNRGEYDAGEYKRVARGGREVWIQASYNPIRDLNGKPYKVVKYASDITPQKNYQMTVENVLKETKTVMMALAEGDLTVSMQGEYTGEFVVLRDAVMQSINNLHKILQQIIDGVKQIKGASTEIAAGNTDLSSRTEEQASSLEETASSMEELSSTVKQNAENAKQANQLASAASSVAIKGGEVVGEVVNTMSAINESSRKIVDIISVIDGIAFQTNILALNAAVEAARAGEQGRGFAVVAAEVRNLAQRSAAAAKEIKQLIGDSVDKVEGGTKLVAQAGQTMEEIVTSVKRVTDIMGEIAAASAEQSSGIEQVNNAITQMDEVTQQNAALVEQAAAAAESLQEQAEELTAAVNTFKLAEEPSSTVRRSTSNVVALEPTKVVPESIRIKPEMQNGSKPRLGKAPQGKAMQAKVKAEEEWEEF